MISRRLIIIGRVQGVFYRESMRQRAQELGITGWVRNRGDGSVEAVVQGDASAVDKLTDWARHGPPAARVERVEVEAAGAVPYAVTFEKLPTV